MNKATVYIAGKVTGLKYEEYAPKFEEAESKIKAMGYKVVNPVKVKGITPITPWITAMDLCKPELQKCDILFMLDDWKESRGSRSEFQTWTIDWRRPEGSFILEQMQGYKSLEYLAKTPHKLKILLECQMAQAAHG